LLAEKAVKQLIRFSVPEVIIFFKDTDKLIEIPGQFFQFDLLLRGTKAEPAFWLLRIPLLNIGRYPCKAILIKAFVKETHRIREQCQSAQGSFLKDVSLLHFQKY
jgi:hypothetical protein